ncbi:hypothetical protein tpqmel_0549 [Candidatus Gastranaerophilus sp. (ex Termes propinquus)]|nr:hypothetical protein tpqmel_0549 [Candidatus Gastranaerophilus sp. (ex Termes propinquus)]
MKFDFEKLRKGLKNYGLVAKCYVNGVVAVRVEVISATMKDIATNDCIHVLRRKPDSLVSTIGPSVEYLGREAQCFIFKAIRKFLK